MPGPWTVRFASGPPLFHPSLGLLPGPPTALVPVDPGGPVLLVDDRNAGERIRQGGHEARLITTSEALWLLAAHHGAVDDADDVDSLDPPEPAFAAITRWKDAAVLLGISTDTLARRRKERDPDRRCYFADAADLRAWWGGLIAPGPGGPTAAPPPRTRRRPAAGAAPVDFTAVARALTGS